MKKHLIAASIFLSPLAPAAATHDLIMSFDGKGTAMAWDAGVVKALFKRIKLDKVKEILFVGSSSGSIASTYFACRGFNKAAVEELEIQSPKFAKEFLNEDSGFRAMQLILDVPPEISYDGILPIIDMAMQGGTCLPKLPILIAAGNLDVLDGRNKRPFGGRRDRKFNRDNYELSLNGTVLGKACTYFVNEPMAKILKDVPENERLCDLRFVRTAAEHKAAILASVAEPTYFIPPEEADLTKISSAYPLGKKRRYGGGFVMNSAAQDVKRSRPAAFVFGTGRASYSRMQNRLIFNWFNFPMNETLLNQRWYFDEQVQITKSEWAVMYEKKTTNHDLIRMGEAKANKCFDAGGCKPDLYQVPFYANDAWDQPLKGLRGRGIKELF